MSELQKLDSWLKGVFASVKADTATLWQEFISALSATWAQISPEVASLAKVAIPLAVEEGANLLSGGGSLVSVGEAIGKSLLASAKTAETNIAPGALNTLANEVVSQVLTHPMVASSEVAKTTLSASTPAATQATVVAAAVTQASGVAGN
jgi:hypothetical protein